MKLTYTKTKLVTETIEIHDWFASDHSRRGLVVDILIGGKGRRDDLYAEDEGTIKAAIDEISRAYEKADKIVMLFSVLEP